MQYFSRFAREIAEKNVIRREYRHAEREQAESSIEKQREMGQKMEKGRSMKGYGICREINGRKCWFKGLEINRAGQGPTYVWAADPAKAVTWSTLKTAKENAREIGIRGEYRIEKTEGKEGKTHGKKARGTGEAEKSL